MIEAHPAPLALGCMRLSTDPGRDEAGALVTIHAALDAGVTLLDTADAYALSEEEAGHNERLIARALSTWSGDRSRVRVATKGGLTRPDGRWVPDGRARHLVAACERSRQALGVDRIFLYQLHAPDPKTPLLTSVRALASLQKDGRIEHIGLGNVTLAQLQQARGVVEIAAVQVELSPWHEENLRNGVAEFCAAEGILLLAHRPLGGTAGARRLARDRAVSAAAERAHTSPAEVVLAWLRSLAPVLVPLPGASTPEHAGSLARVAALQLAGDVLSLLDERFPAGRLLRTPRAARRPPAEATGDVVLVAGLPGAGKSTIAEEFLAEGYVRLNRDLAGGRLADLVPRLETALAAGQRRVILDNTYGARAARNAVIEAAWAHGTDARCIWLETSLEDAQVNVCQRLLARHGRLLEPEELKDAARKDPGALSPQVLFRHRREWEPPTVDEGFSRVEVRPFQRRPRPERETRALVLWLDGVVRESRGGFPRPLTPDDVALLPERREVVRRHVDEGWRVLGLSWLPEVERGTATREAAEATNSRTQELLGVELPCFTCFHGEGPPLCWCRKPLPGLGVVMIERYGLDPARCVYVGRDAGDAAFARTLGFRYRAADDVFCP